jgi:hypothetical protein
MSDLMAARAASSSGQDDSGTSAYTHARQESARAAAIELAMPLMMLNTQHTHLQTTARAV